MNRLILWSRDHPWLVLILISLASLFFAYHARNVEIDASGEGMMIENDPDHAFYEETLKQFGSDNITVVYVKDRQLFTPEKLKAVEEVFYQLQEISGVSRVDALYNATNFKGENGSLSTNPLLDWISEDAQELQQVRADALRSPLLNKTLIAPHGQGIALTITADYNPKDRKFNVRIADEIDRLIAPLKAQVEEVFQVGGPMTRRHLSRTMITDQQKLVPLSFIVLMIMLIIGIRTWNGGIVPTITGGLSILWTIGYMGLTGIPLNVLTLIVPSLLIVVGSAEDLHMVAEYLEGLAHTKSRLGAIEFFGKRLGLTVLLTAFTTYLGFLSIAINDITLLKQFGLASSFGFLVNPIITFSVIPVYLRFFGEKKPPKSYSAELSEKGGDFYRRCADRITDFNVKHAKPVIWISILVTLVVACGAFFVKLDNNLLAYFKPNSEIRIRSTQLHKELSGGQNFFIVFDGREKGAFKKPENLKKIFDIQQYMQESGLYDSSISLATHVSFISREMANGKPEMYKIPDSADLIAQYLLFFTRSDLERYVTSDYQRANIIVRHNLSSSYEMKKAIQKLEAVIRAKLGNTLDYKLTGEYILINKAADTMAAGQITSLSILLFVLFVIMTVLFLRVKAGLLAMASNVVPIFMLFGIMGYFNIPLNVGTAMIADIAIGIAVDDTIHLMVLYNTYMKQLNNQAEALRMTMRDEFKPVLSVTSGLTLGFAIMAFSDLVPLVHFGLLSAMVMVIGLAAEFLVTAALLSNTKLITLWDMLALQLKERVIKGSELFRNMSPWQIKKIVLMGHTKEVAKDDYVIRQGERDRTMFLILEGSVNVEYVNELGTHTFLKQLAPGDIFGEIALVDEVERTANVIAAEECKVLTLDWASLERIRKIFPRISTKFFLNISRILGTRLALANAQLSKTQAHSL